MFEVRIYKPDTEGEMKYSKTITPASAAITMWSKINKNPYHANMKAQDDKKCSECENIIPGEKGVYEKKTCSDSCAEKRTKKQVKRAQDKLKQKKASGGEY